MKMTSNADSPILGGENNAQPGSGAVTEMYQSGRMDGQVQDSAAAQSDNRALEYCQMQLKLLEPSSKKSLMMPPREQDDQNRLFDLWLSDLLGQQSQALRTGLGHELQLSATTETSQAGAWLPSSTRGRKRRRARRQRGSTADANAIPQSSTALRGRALRSHKRHARMLSRRDHSGAPERTSGPSLREESFSAARPSSSRPAPLSSRHGRESAPSGTRSFHPTSDSSSLHQPEPKGDASLAWLVNAGTKWPILFRKISDYLDHPETPKPLLLDHATAVAIQIMGEDHSNELLAMILEGSASTDVTTPAMQNLVEWTSPQLFNRLMAVATLPASSCSQLLLSAVRNKAYGLEILHELTDGYRSYMGHDSLNILLERVINTLRIALVPRRGDRPRGRDDPPPDSTGHYAKFCDTLVAKYSGGKIFSSTLNSIIIAEAGIPTYERPWPWPPTKHLMDRCTDCPDVTNLLRTALADCSTTTVRLLLDQWPEAVISKSGLLAFLHRDVKQPVRNQDGEAGDILGQLIGRYMGPPVEDVALLNSLNSYRGPEMMGRLRAMKADFKVSKLMARLVIRAFNPKDLREHFAVEDIAWDKTNVKAAMEEQVQMPKRRDQRVVRFLAMLVPPQELSIDVIQLAAQATPYSLFKKILGRSPVMRIPSFVLLSVMRSPYPAMRKVRLLIETSPFRDEDFDANFWPTLISSNHEDTVQVLKFLRKKYALRTSNATIVAACRTDDPERVVRVLIRDPSFTVSRSTICALIREAERVSDKRRVLRCLLKYTKSDFIDSELIAESLRNRRYCRALLRKHGAPKELFITERKFMDLLGQGHQTRNSVLRESLADYLRAGGRLAITERVLGSMLRHDFASALQLWRNQTAVDFYTMACLCVKFEISVYHPETQVLDFWLRDGPAEFDEEAFRIFEMRKPADRHNQYQHSHFWEVLLSLIFNGDRSKFESAYARLGEHKVPQEALQRLCASLVVRASNSFRIPSNRRKEDFEPSNLFNYVADRFSPVILGPCFFEAVKEKCNSLSALQAGRLHKANWLALLNSPIDIEWDVYAEEVLFSCEPFELIIEVVKLMGKELTLSENVVLAAIKSKSALLKLEFMWQYNNAMAVTMNMIEAAARTTIVEVLDFLMARYKVAHVTEELLAMAIQGVRPAKRPRARFRTHVVECLLAQAGDLTLSNTTLELGVRNLTETTAERLLLLGAESISKALLLAMVDMKWQPERMYRILCRSAEGLGYLDDQEIIEHCCQTEHGRSFLLFAKSSDNNIRGRIEEKVFEAAKYSTSTLLDHLHRSSEIHLDDEALAHLWDQSTRFTMSSKQVLFHVLESGVTGRIGAKTFGMFWTTCMDRRYYLPLDKRALPRVTGQLPPLPVDVTDELISVAKNGFGGRTALDYILGPDHEITIHQSALQKCARLGEELWLHRLLSRMSAEEIFAVDGDALLEAAREGGTRSIIEFCRSFAGKPPRVISRRKAVRDALRREHYMMRQRLRIGRPRVARPLRRGFFRFRLFLRIFREGRRRRRQGHP